ncbi:hypothetical protein ACN20G_37105 (plasmid) [Streptomyces sp. BI20]|uniref:hypothetical protein n=1 Tax=Streptomyces sp. BI20 TaxID=3403460 RepID=UPI003C714571
MADQMTPDEMLRACGYLEAVWMEDTASGDVLLRHEPGERPTAVLVAELGALIMQTMLPPQFGIHGGLSPQELEAAAARMNADPTVRVSKVWVETLTELAAGATAAQAETIGRSLIGYLLAISNAAADDVPMLIDTLRQGALHRPGPA